MNSRTSVADIPKFCESRAGRAMRLIQNPRYRNDMVKISKAMNYACDVAP